MTMMTRAAFLRGTTAAVGALMTGCGPSGWRAPSAVGADTTGIAPGMTGDDTLTPAAATPTTMYRPGSTVLPYGTVDCPDDQFVIGLTARDTDTALVLCGSFASTAPHQAVVARIMDGAQFDVLETGTVPFRPLAAPVQNPRNPDSAFVAMHSNDWGFAQVYGATVALTGAVPSSYSNGAVFLGDTQFASGLLVVAGSNFEAGQFGDGQLTVIDLQRFATSDGQKGLAVLSSGGINVGGMAEVMLDSEPHLMVVNAGAISHLGAVQSPGSLTLIPVSALSSAFASTRRNGATLPGTRTYPLPGGLAIGQGISIADTADGPVALLPSAANDGRVYFLPLHTVDGLERRRRFDRAHALDMEFLTLPDVVPGAMAYVNLSQPSPDHAWAMAVNVNTGQAHRINIAARAVDGAPLVVDATPLNSREPVSGLWTTHGYLTAVGRDIQRIPYGEE